MSEGLSPSQEQAYQRLKAAQEAGERERAEKALKELGESEPEPEAKEPEQKKELEEAKAEAEQKKAEDIKDVREKIEKMQPVPPPEVFERPPKEPTEEEKYKKKLAEAGLIDKFGVFYSYHKGKIDKSIDKAVSSTPGQVGLGILGGAIIAVGAVGYVAYKIFKEVLWDPTLGKYLNEPLKKVFTAGKNKK